MPPLYLDGDEDTKRSLDSWHSLLHVCRRWRGLVFESPRRLKLQLYCTPRTPARETLNVWPALPLFIHGDVSETSVDNVIAELEHSDRIRQIELSCHTTSQLEKIWTAMQVTFPELQALCLSCGDRDLSYEPVLPVSFSAPCLRSLTLAAVSLQRLPKLFLSATHLIVLCLQDIPHSGYISPEAMVTCITMLTSLSTLRLQFESPRSCPDQENRRSPPPTRSILPFLTMFEFKGVNEYLEDLLARIDIPRLSQLSATFFNDIDFETPELIRFLSRSSTFNTPNDAHVVFDSRIASFNLRQDPPHVVHFKVGISCRATGWQLSSLAQLCTSSLPLLSTTENLYIHERLQSQLDWKDGVENTEWLELLLPFAAVKGLYLSKQFTPRIAPALQELTGERATEVLPALQNIFLEGFQPSGFHEGIGQFVSVRQLTNRPVAVSIWERYEEKEWPFVSYW